MLAEISCTAQHMIPWSNLLFVPFSCRPNKKSQQKMRFNFQLSSYGKRQWSRSRDEVSQATGELLLLNLKILSSWNCASRELNRVTVLSFIKRVSSECWRWCDVRWAIKNFPLNFQQRSLWDAEECKNEWDLCTVFWAELEMRLRNFSGTKFFLLKF